MNSILFSVIIPTYNRAHLITKTLKSVFSQCFTSYEIIVVDNFSTDNTQEVLSPYITENKIRYIRNDKNYERAHSRNIGMKNAIGQYLTFLDSDDIMYPTNLLDAMHYIKEHPDVYFFHNLYELINEKGALIYSYPFKNINNPLRAIANGNFLSNIGVFLHKKIYSSYRFDTNPQLTSFEDWEMWLRVLSEYKLGRINKINNGIVQHPERTVNTFNIEKTITPKELMIYKLKNNIGLAKIYAPYLNRIEASGNIYCAIIANKENQYNTAIKLLLNAFISDKLIIFSKRFVTTLVRSVLHLK